MHCLLTFDFMWRIYFGVQELARILDNEQVVLACHERIESEFRVESKSTLSTRLDSYDILSGPGQGHTHIG